MPSPHTRSAGGFGDLQIGRSLDFDLRCILESRGRRIIGQQIRMIGGGEQTLIGDGIRACADRAVDLRIESDHGWSGIDGKRSDIHADACVASRIAAGDCACVCCYRTRQKSAVRTGRVGENDSAGIG